MQPNPIMENCLFCEIIEHKRSAVFLYEDDRMIAIRDAHPLAPFHILIIPKKHIPSLNRVNEEDESLLSDLIIKARDLAFANGNGENGYRVVINTGIKGGQTVFHLHVHLLGGVALDPELMSRGL